ncbi:MAG: helix-turn-helix domain-containing protein [Myxacorys chilensis ATA2-1-KO14]|jgi:hypothetical protein|nr:helix-turn-helix domain-containing protein [Myxacorys chilensis ATA2-1-KO14]
MATQNYTWINKYEVAKLLNIHWKTAGGWRLSGEAGWIEGIHYQQVGRQFLYNKELLEDWIAHRNDPNGHLAAIEAYQATLKSNQSKRRRAS